MSAGQHDQGRSQKLGERPCHRLDGQERVPLAPEDERRGAAGAQRLADVLGLARIEVPGGANELQAALLALVGASISRTAPAFPSRLASTGASRWASAGFHARMLATASIAHSPP